MTKNECTISELSACIDGDYKRYMGDIGGDFYILPENKICQAKYYHGKSKIDYGHLAHTTQARVLYDMDSCVLARTSDSSLTFNAQFALQAKLGKWEDRIIDIDETIQKSVDEVFDENIPVESRAWQVECGELIWNENVIHLQAPPGAGKGNLFIQYVLRAGYGRHVFLVPRIDLATQMLKRFQTSFGDSFKVCVVGDSKNLPKYFENSKNVVVICVFNSFEKMLHTKYESLWKDEAHLYPELDIQQISAEKYVLMSATMSPELMNDEKYSTFTYSLSQAIQDKVVADYRIGIVFISKGDVMDASCDYVSTHPELYPVQVFCNSKERVLNAYQKLSSYEQTNGMRKPRVEYVLGEMSSKKKEEIRCGIEDGTIDIIVVCQCFTVGTDMPRLRTTFMLDKKSSKQSLIQASLRCLRIHFSKINGLIYIPLYHPENNSYDENKDLSFLIDCLQEQDERLNDPKFLRCVTQIKSENKERDGNEENEENDESESGKYLFDTFYDIIRDTIEKKVEEFLCEMKDRDKIISQTDKTTFIDGTFMGSFWSDCKRYERFLNLPYSRLLKNPVLKKEYEKSQMKKKFKMSIEEKIEEFISFMKTQGKIISRTDKTKFKDGTFIEKFWSSCKRLKKCDNFPYSRLLENKLLIDDYKQNQTKKEVKMRREEKIEEFLCFMKPLKKTVLQCDKAKFKDGTFIGSFWNTCKKRKSCANHPYSRLLENPVLKSDYENFLKNKEIKKNFVKMTMNEKVEAFLCEIQNREKIISNNDEAKFKDGSFVGKFWSACKMLKKCENLPYSRLLENPVLKNDYEKVK